MQVDTNFKRTTPYIAAEIKEFQSGEIINRLALKIKVEPAASLTPEAVLAMDEWPGTSFSSVFQSYQEDGWVIMKGCLQWYPNYNCKDLRLRQG